jgi:hypothetical protein
MSIQPSSIPAITPRAAGSSVLGIVRVPELQWIEEALR